MARAKSPRSLSVNGLSEPDWRIIQLDMKPVRINGIEKDYKRLLWEADSYIHTEIDDKKKAESFIKYCEKNFDKKKATLLKRLPEYTFSTVGKITLLLEKGVGYPEERIASLKGYYESFLSKAAELEKQKARDDAAKAKTNVVVVSIQQRMREQVSDLCAHWDHLVDELCHKRLDVATFDPYAQMQSYKDNMIKAAHAKIIKEMYAGQFNEAKEVVAWKDEQIKEGYAYMTAKMRKEFLAFYEKINIACDTFINTGKAVRKTRKKKAVSKDKIVSKLKYKQSEPSLGIASINPMNILDAQVLWVYNTKNRKLGVYVAEEHHTLGIKGTTILNYKESASVQKTVRKPELLKGADKLARTKFQKLFDGFNATEIPLNGRLNEHTVLIKVF